MKIYLAILAWSIALSQAAEQDPAEVLKRVAATVLAREAALPNYTCVETVTRDYFQPIASRAAATPMRSCSALSGLPVLRTMTDRLRLDVTITRGGEIYSWAGASKFAEGGIDQVVKDGPIGTGSFGALLAVVFQQNVKTFRFARYLLDNGRGLMEYSFEVRKETSKYKVKTGYSWEYVAYSGTFQADPETGDVVRLTMQSAELPSATGNCQTNTTMDFSPTRIGDGEFLLPKGAWQRFLSRTGDGAENTMDLSSCREYKGESTISFSGEPAPVGNDGQPTGPARIQLPARLPFTFELTTPISVDTAAAGDRLAGRLVSALRDNKGKILSPSHAIVEGRVMRVEIYHSAPGGAAVALRLTTVEIGGVKTPLEASRKVVSSGDRRERTAIQVPLPGEQNAGIFQLSGQHAAIKAGFRSEWQTVAASEAAPGSR